MRSSHETADPRLVEALVGDAQGAIHWLEELGCAFTRENGGYRLARCGGASRKRLLQVGDRTGHAITKALRDAHEAGGATSFQNHALSALEPTGARLARVVHRQGRRRRHDRRRHGRAGGRRALLRRGGPPPRALHEPSQRDRRGDARSRSTLGAESRDLDALQYHPNGGAWPVTMQGYSIPETTRAYGAVLLNADGEEFTDSLGRAIGVEWRERAYGVLSMAEARSSRRWGPRDVVSQAIFDEVAAGRGVETEDGRPAVYLDTTRIPEADADVSLPYMLRRYRGAGIDPLTEPLLTYPVLHYQNGGLVIDEHAETTLEGLYACGEIAGGTHGRNRMMGNSLLECVVFGRRAGRAASEKASL